MARIEESIEVGVPVRAAYDQWTRFEEFPRFMEGVEEVRQLDDAHLHWRAAIAGSTHEWDAEITEQVPDRIIAWKSTSGYHTAGAVRFDEEGPDRTLVTVVMEHSPEGVGERVGEWLGMADRRVRGDLGRFRELVESGGGTGDGWRGEIIGGRTVSEPGP